MLRRPETIVTLPPLVEEEVYFSLNADEEGQSNEKFETYKTAMRIAASERKKDPPYKSLIHALQLACHPKLVELMQFISFQDVSRKRPSDYEEDVLYEAEDIARWSAWRQNLRDTGSWISYRCPHQNLQPMPRSGPRLLRDLFRRKRLLSGHFADRTRVHVRASGMPAIRRTRSPGESRKSTTHVSRSGRNRAEYCMGQHGHPMRSMVEK